MIPQALGQGLVSATASASSRSAVTGVRSRWERSATAARSAASSSLIRSARPLSARASSSVSSVPRTPARAAEVAAAELVGDVGDLAERLGEARALPRAVASASASSSTPSPTMPSQALVTPACRSSGATLVRTTAVPSSLTTGSSTRPPESSTTSNASPPRARCTSGSSGSMSPVPSTSPLTVSTAVSAAPRRVEALDDLGHLLVVDAGDQDGDVAGLLVRRGHRPVLGQRLDEQAQRDHERDDHGRRGRQDQP